MLSNYLESIFSFQFATYSFVASGLDLLRVWYGPLPAGFCQLILLLKGTLGNTGPFIVAGIVAIKFLYICVWKRFKTIEDDLIRVIIVRTAYFLGFLMVLTKNLAPGKPTYNTVRFLFYSFTNTLAFIFLKVCCTGVYKSSYDQMKKKIPTEIGFLIPIVMCQILTPIIQWQKNKLNMTVKQLPINLHSSEMQSDHNLERLNLTNQNVPNLESLAFYFIANIFFILCVIVIGLANG